MTASGESAYGAEPQPFAAIASCMRCPVTRELSSVALVGLPYGGGTSYRGGASFGPRKIREASLKLSG
jgi:arginase family enzyme